MSKNALLLVIVLLLTSSIFTSCEKGPDDLLTEHSWHGIVLDLVAEDGTVAYSYDLSNVELIFKDDGKFEVYHSEDLENDGTWSYEEGDPDILLMKDNNDEEDEEYTVEELTEDNLTYYNKITAYGETYKYLYKYKK